MTPAPRVASFLLCDRITEDAGHKLSLHGLFNALSLDSFPAVVRDTWLYCALSGGRGEVRVSLRLVDAADLDPAPVIATAAPVTFRGPLDVAEVALSFEALRFPAPGVYAWQVLAGGELLDERRIGVTRAGG